MSLILRICDFCIHLLDEKLKFLLNSNSSDNIPDDVHRKVFEIEKVYPMQASENDKQDIHLFVNVQNYEWIVIRNNK